MKDSVFIKWHVDGIGREFVEEIRNEKHIVIDGQFVLNQVPSKFHKVKITNLQLFETSFQKPLTPTLYKVDYNIGIVYVDSSLNGQLIIVDYFGKGIVYYPSSRIYTEVDDNGNVVDTVGSIIDVGYQAIDNLKQFNEVYTNVVNATNTANQLSSDFSNAEDIRVTNENDRELNETTRINAEGDATKGRVKEENTRMVNENQRIVNENIRVTNEQNRTVEFDGWRTSISNAGKIGDVSQLQTTDKSTIVGAINENKQNIDNTNGKIGDVTQLSTTNKNNTVGAINELNTNKANSLDVNSALNGKVNTTDVATTAIANKILKLDSNAKLPASITGDANTLDGKHAAVTLNTTEKNDLAGAINELDSTKLDASALTANFAVPGYAEILIGAKKLTFMWGTATTLSEVADSGLYTAYVDVTLPKSFSTKCVKCWHNPIAMNLAFPTYAYATALNKCRFYLTSTISGQCGTKAIEWFAIGY